MKTQLPRRKFGGGADPLPPLAVSSRKFNLNMFPDHDLEAVTPFLFTIRPNGYSSNNFGPISPSRTQSPIFIPTTPIAHDW